jgi:hypothetical protein
MLAVARGALTHLLKKNNNKVFGTDISSTAIKRAEARYPDIDFFELDVNSEEQFNNFLAEVNVSHPEGVDLIFSSETLSYLDQYANFLRIASLNCKFIMISLYLPENPIGFIKSPEHLELEMKKYFDILEVVYIKKLRSVIVFGKSMKV